jgi:hypothetical protein
MARRVAIAAVAGVAIVGMTLILLLVAGRSLYSRAAFGTWDATALPTRISYCDRTYLPGWHRTRAQIDAVDNQFGVFPFQQVGTTADGKLIFARPMPETIRHKYPNAAPLPCDTQVYLKAGPDDYITYGISGGP